MGEARKDVAQWLAIRKEQAKFIDPETAEVMWIYGPVLDPYGVHQLHPDEEYVGRLYFARAPASDIWVSFCDLPSSTRDALWQKHGRKLRFPAGLFVEDLDPSDLF